MDHDNPFEKPVESKKAVEQLINVEESPELVDRLHRLGIADIATFDAILLKSHFVGPWEKFSLHQLEEKEGVSKFLESVESAILGLVYDRQDLGLALSVLTLTFDYWRDHPSANRIMNSLAGPIMSGLYRGYGERREMGRLIGGNFGVYGNLFSEKEGQEIQKMLLEYYPMGIISSFDLKGIDPEIARHYDLDNAIPVSGIQLLSAPYELDSAKRIRTYDFCACENAEAYHVIAAGEEKNRVLLYAGGRLLGALKKVGQEWSFIALESAVQDNKPIILKGGMYQLHGIRFGEDATEVSLESIKEGVQLLPIRLWESDNTAEYPGIDKPTSIDDLKRMHEENALSLHV